MKVKVIFHLLLILVLAASFSVLSGCKSTNRIDFGSRTITNDTWGAPSDEVLSSGIYLNKDKSFGWYWERKNPKKKTAEDPFVRPIFPNVRVGGSLSVVTNAVGFPVKQSDIRSLRFDLDYEYLTIPDGAYNLAYEMLLSDSDRHGSNLVPKAEVMVWLHATFPQPANTYKGDFSDGNNTYELYSWVMPDERLYASFIMKGQPKFQAQHTVDAKKLMDNLTLDSNWYVHGVELGSEIVNGSGKIKINKLNINLNGRDVQSKPFWWQTIFK